MNCEKVYNLIQQTPMIHFQHDQTGAVLRATEVKPKLDKFIIRKMGGVDNVPESWFLKDTTALNYKMRIQQQGNKEIVELGLNTDYDIFYGNMGNSEVKKKGVKANCKLSIVCMIEKLREFIDSCIAEFFIVTNFGTMQNKGFGSYIVKTDETYTAQYIAECLKNAYDAKHCYKFNCNENQFKTIKLIYSIMKSGVNFRTYQRSLLFLFMHNEYSMGNEKAWMKENKIAPSDVGDHASEWHRNHSDHKAYYVRALLGVCEHIEFLKNLKNRKDKLTVNISSSEIERLHSPIFFKIIGNNVYYIARQIPDEIYGATFEFSSPEGHGKLTVPTKDELGENFIEDFLVYCKTELNTVKKNFRDISLLNIEEV